MASASLVGMDKRKKDLEVIPEAESAYGDWKGTSCAENSLMVTSGDLYELAGLAAERDHLRRARRLVHVDAEHDPRRSRAQHDL